MSNSTTTEFNAAMHQDEIKRARDAAEITEKKTQKSISQK